MCRKSGWRQRRLHWQQKKPDGKQRHFKRSGKRRVYIHSTHDFASLHSLFMLLILIVNINIPARVRHVCTDVARKSGWRQRRLHVWKLNRKLKLSAKPQRKPDAKPRHLQPNERRQTNYINGGITCTWACFGPTSHCHCQSKNPDFPREVGPATHDPPHMRSQCLCSCSLQRSCCGMTSPKPTTEQNYCFVSVGGGKLFCHFALLPFVHATGILA